MRHALSLLCCLSCTAAMALVLAAAAGCQPDLPGFGYGQAEFHAGRDLEAEQGIRQQDGWTRSSSGRWRLVEELGRLWVEWRTEVANPTGMPRRLGARITFALNPPAPGAADTVPVHGEDRVVVAPHSVQEIGGKILVPEDCAALVAGAVNKSTLALGVGWTIDPPLSEPTIRGPAVLRCVSCKDGMALIEWKSTTTPSTHFLRVIQDGAGGRRESVKTVLSDIHECTLVLLDEANREILRRTVPGLTEASGAIVAADRIEMPAEVAADIHVTCVSWESKVSEARIRQETGIAPVAPPEPPPAGRAKDARRTIRMRVAAYCPCRICCGRRARGLTATQTYAYDRGVAADWRFLPPGTRLLVPAYGQAVEVDDTGGALRQAWAERRQKGIEIRFTTHAEALAWGVQWLDVQVLKRG